jgi:multiple sugar transport system ATP-binding protein
MRDGRIVQVDTPQRLYRDPVDLYVAGFIGTPAMNLVEARVEGGEVVFGSNRLALDPSRRPPPGATEIVLGIRPEGFEDAGFARPGLPALDATVTVLEELGADAHVFFNVDARPAGATKAAGADTSILADEGTLFTARVDPRTSARVGERITLAVDPARFHFFDAESGRSLVGTAAAEQPTSELAPAAG